MQHESPSDGMEARDSPVFIANAADKAAKNTRETYPKLLNADRDHATSVYQCSAESALGSVGKRTFVNRAIPSVPAVLS